MQGEGISTPHIHRTRWDPFSSKHVCVFSVLISYLLITMLKQPAEHHPITISMKSPSNVFYLTKGER